MKKKRLLFGVSSVGLGHVKRSLLVADEIRRLQDVEIDWMSSEPINSFLKAKGENVLQTLAPLASLTEAFNENCKNGKITSVSGLLLSLNSRIKKNREILIRSIMGSWDVVVCDEFWELLDEKLLSSICKGHSVFITDFLKYEYNGLEPFTRFVVWLANRQLHKGLERYAKRILLFGYDKLNQEDSWYFFGPKLLNWVSLNCILIKNFSLGLRNHIEKKEARQRLGLPQDGTVVTVCIGGSAVGEILLKKIIDSSEQIATYLKDELTIMALCGPFVDPARLPNSRIVKKVGLVYDSEIYYIASDCVVTLAGLATLLELEALRVPALIVPIENHFEQEKNAEMFASKPGNLQLGVNEINAKNLGQKIKAMTAQPKKSIQNDTSAHAHWANEVAQAVISPAGRGTCAHD